MNKKIPVRSLFVVWVFVWALFLLRPYFKNGLLKEYSTLLKASLDEKRSHVTGSELYDFLRFCNASVRPPSTYDMKGLEDESLSLRRAAYYLYPNVKRTDPEYIFVYKVKNFSKEGYGHFAVLNSEEYILKKTK